MFRFLMPFQHQLWGTVVASIFVAGIATYIVTRLSPITHWSLKRKHPDIVTTRQEISLGENLWSAFGAIMQQGQDFYPSAHSSRVVFSCWWFFGLAMFAAYQGDLVAFLAMYIPNTFSSIDELSRQSRVKILVTPNASGETLLKVECISFHSYLGVRKFSLGNMLHVQ